MNQLSRRTLLRGAGAALALPVLDIMLPNTGLAAGGTTGPNRMAFVFFPNGAIMKDWTPQEVGTNFTLPKTLTPLADVQSDLTVITGLAHDKARANGDGAGDHARSSAAFLTGSQPRKTDGADIKLGQSIDQAVAEKVGKETRLPSLEVGTEAGRQAGQCDSGYSCAYVSNISWRSEATPTGKEINPKAVFERMFGSNGENAKEVAKRNFFRQSILDFVAEDAKRLQDQLGKSDRHKMDEYFTSVREVEQRIERATDEAKRTLPDREAPEGIPKDWAEHTRLMYDLMVLAFQTDTTRIATFMLHNEGSNKSYKEIGVSGGHHELSHHRDEADKIEALQKIDQYMVEQFAYFLKQLKSVKEGEHNLLHNSMIVYGCSISDSNRHRHEDLPILVAGHGAGSINAGRHLKLKGEVPMTNMFLSLADRMGANLGSFGDSTAILQEL
ncbi:MAG: DUF1552 domain-containing protein [Planctomycetaceae bacterium]|nr:DUF1552 domain-containing protein [Planctomycetaceae bacterium]